MGGQSKAFEHASVAILYVEPGMPFFDHDTVRHAYPSITSYSMLPAITVDGIIYSHIKIGSYNGNQFLEWLEGVLGVMNPYPAPHSVLILDNCQIHHVPGVVELCDEWYVIYVSIWCGWCLSDISDVSFSGIKLIYLPPYSPDLNPIEECFSFVKHYIRRHGHQFRDIVEIGDDIEPYLFLYNVLDQVTPEACRGWFHDSGYV